MRLVECGSDPDECTAYIDEAYRCTEKMHGDHASLYFTRHAGAVQPMEASPIGLITYPNGLPPNSIWSYQFGLFPKFY